MKVTDIAQTLVFAIVVAFFIGLSISYFKQGVDACKGKLRQGLSLGDVFVTLIISSAIISWLADTPLKLIEKLAGIELEVSNSSVFTICIIISIFTFVPILLSSFIHPNSRESR